jgi:hypothetical protein
VPTSKKYITRALTRAKRGRTICATSERDSSGTTRDGYEIAVRVMERIARRECARAPEVRVRRAKRLAQIQIKSIDKSITTTEKLVYVISRLLLFSKSTLRLILKIKATLFET